MADAAERHRLERQKVWRLLLNAGGNAALMRAVVRDAMAEHAVAIVVKTHHWEMTLLGKRASCTSYPEGVLSNWAEARLKEFGG